MPSNKRRHPEQLEPRHLLSSDGLFLDSCDVLSINDDTSPVAAASAGGEASSAQDDSPGVAAGQALESVQQWHAYTLTFDGPQSSETAASNPQLNYRLDVTFTSPDGSRSFVVPGYYAADGNAGFTHATSGNKWRVHFMPDQVGTWSYTVSFRSGSNVAVATSPTSGSSAGFFDGDSGQFQVIPSDKTDRDFRAPEHGLIKNFGEQPGLESSGFYLTYAGSGDVFLKGGPDIPENFLGYTEFDNTDRGRVDLHTFAAHTSDWNEGDPTWDFDGDADSDLDNGKAIIGALNFIAETGSNVIYFLPMNLGGDGQDAYPFVNKNQSNNTKYDVSKLDQWQIMFEHAQAKGIFLHFQLAETEFANENWFDNGNLGNQRKLFYRMMVARFGHLPGLQWDLGEENDFGTTKLKQFASFIKSVDPYDHPLTTHTKGNQWDNYYEPLRGDQNFDMTGFQGSGLRLTQAENEIEEWRRKSDESGARWVISVDEPQRIDNDKNDTNRGYPFGRTDFLWPIYMSGGGGFEWYVQEDGGGHAFDQAINDFNDMDVALEWTGHAIDFLTSLPLQEMSPNKALGRSNNGQTTYVLQKPGEVYALYDENGGTMELNLTGQSGQYDVQFFNPRTGEIHTTGRTIAGGGWRSLGAPPNTTNQDWAALVRRQGSQGPNQPPMVSIDSVTPINTAGGVYQEQNGLVVMEMENTETDNIGLWNEETSINGYTGDGYLQFTGNSTASGPANSPLEFKFKINRSGLYYLHLRAARDTTHGQPSDHSNDAYVRVDGDYGAGPNAGNNHGDHAPLSMLKSNTKFFGGNADSFSWNSGNRLDPGGHNNKRVAVYDFKAGEEYTLVVSGRSKWFSVDRIVFRHQSVSNGTAQNLNNPESEQSGGFDNAFRIDATVVDDGQVLFTPALQWTLESGPTGGTAQFSNPRQEDTDVIFSQTGQYVVKLTADDGELMDMDTRTIFVSSAPNSAPTANAGADKTVLLPSQVTTLVATAVDDGQPDPPANLTYQWRQLSGPANAVLQNESAASTQVTFASVEGVYEFEVTVNDGQLEDTDTVQVRVTDGVNVAPDIAIVGVDEAPGGVPGRYRLSSAATDDDNDELTLNWNVLSGPGSATGWSGKNSTDAQVTFSQNGAYVVQFTASDGQEQVGVTRTVFVTTADAVSGDNLFAPIEDAYVQGNNGLNDAFIKTEDGNRTGYLKFTVSGIGSAPVTSAKLRLTVAGSGSENGGNGPLRLFNASTNNWTETGINSGNAPNTSGGAIATANGSFTLGQVVEFDVASRVAGDGTYSFVLDHGGSNDVWFSSKEGSSAPQLVLNVAVDPDETVVADQWLFHNNSSFDGNDPALGTADAAARAAGKSALLPGEVASFANYTSNHNGITGLTIEIENLLDPNNLGLDDFAFRTGNSQDIESWAQEGPIPTDMHIRLVDDDLYAVSFAFAEGTIVGEWLETTVLNTPQTGLDSPAVFYFGSAPGEVGNSTIDTVVNLADVLAVRQNFTDDATIENTYDIDRDGDVDVTDMQIAAANQTNSFTQLVLLDLTPPTQRLTVPVLAGDYDGNGVVDQGDYDVWRTDYGSVDRLAADGNGNNAVDLGDYVIWRDNLGATAEPGLATASTEVAATLQSTSSTPAPTSFAVTAVASDGETTEQIVAAEGEASAVDDQEQLLRRRPQARREFANDDGIKLRRARSIDTALTELGDEFRGRRPWRWVTSQR